jgi:hypothetical protein
MRSVDVARRVTGSGNESQIGPVLTGASNFPEAIRGSFLTESLILAQNERWRRG